MRAAIATSSWIAGLAACAALAACSNSSGGGEPSDEAGAGSSSGSSSGSSTSSSSSGGGVAEGGGSDGASDSSPGTCSGTVAIGAASCNSLTNGATVVPVTASTGQPPTETGGKIVSGTYYLTSAIEYDPSSLCPANSGVLQALGEQIQTTIMVDTAVDASGPAVQAITYACDVLGATAGRSTGTFSTATDYNGSLGRDAQFLAYTSTCGAASFDIYDPAQWRYTATASAITLINDSVNSSCATPLIFVEVYTKQ
jgi:hypothetical protein